LNKPAETTYVIEVVNTIEEAKENIINDVQAIISKEKQIHFTIDELSEMEVLDAYHNQVKKYYPSKNQIPF